MCKKIVLIRHGETDYSRKKKYCGGTDVKLNKTGVNQAKKLVNLFKAKKIDKVYSSDLSRALEFAKIVFSRSSIEPNRNLRELNFGVFEGLTYREIIARYESVYKKWLENPLNVRVPKGEGLRDLAYRVRKVVAQIRKHNSGKVVALVTHAGPIKVVLCDVMQMSLDSIWHLNCGLSSVTTIDFSKSKPIVI